MNGWVINDLLNVINDLLNEVAHSQNDQTAYNTLI